MIYPSYLVTSLIFDGQAFPRSTDIVANEKIGPSSVIAFFAMGFPALLAITRATRDQNRIDEGQEEVDVRYEKISLHS